MSLSKIGTAILKCATPKHIIAPLGKECRWLPTPIHHRISCGCVHHDLNLMWTRSMCYAPQKPLGPRFVEDPRKYEDAYRKAAEEPDEFWAEHAQALTWEKTWDKVLDNSDEPFTKWFVGGRMNVCYNAVDRHVENGFGEQVAIIHDSPVTNTIRKITYKELQDMVSRLAGVLSKYGVKKGDVVLIYMPMIPEAMVAMLASARLGAIHSLVFGGFASKELSTRINHAEPKIIVSANCSVEGSKVVAYKPLLDKAIELSDFKPKKVIMFNREEERFEKASMTPGQDLCWKEEMAGASPHDCVAIPATDPLYILYTSGTTGIPKAVVRPSGGHAVILNWSMFNIYGVHPHETWFAASDLGWVVGHSYINYAPLLHCNTTVLYEGKPIGTPDPGSYFRMFQDHKIVSMFVAPTALRALRREDPEGYYAEQYKFPQYADDHGNRAAARHFGINEANIRRWKRDRAKLEAMPKTKKALRGRGALQPALEAHLLGEVQERREAGIPISTTEVRLRALQVAAEVFNIPQGTFKASYSWVTRFRYLFVAGEHCDHETMEWTKHCINAPVLDNWWQTETGHAITSTSVGLGCDLYPPFGTTGKPVPGWKVEVVRKDMTHCDPHELGQIVARLPLPPGNFSTLWKNDERFAELYFSTYPGFYDTMDAGFVDEHGNIAVMARSDDVINVAGHRLSTGQLEEAVLEHPDIAEAAVVGMPDKVKGQIPLGLCVLKHGMKKTHDELLDEVKKIVREQIGPVASFKDAIIVRRLPKTRSGKVARNTIAAMVAGQPYKIPVTIEDANVYVEIIAACKNAGFSPSNPTL